MITPDAPLDMTGQLTAFLIDLALRHPWIVTVFGLIGFLRVIFKPAMALLHGYVATTQDKSDDELLEKVERELDLRRVLLADRLLRIGKARHDSEGPRPGAYCGRADASARALHCR